MLSRLVITCLPRTKCLLMSLLRLGDKTINGQDGTSVRTEDFSELCAVLIRSVVSNFWDPVDCSPPGSSVYGILQARILERSAISFSRWSSQRKDPTCSNPCLLCLLHWQADSLPLNHLGSPCRKYNVLKVRTIAFVLERRVEVGLKCIQGGEANSDHLDLELSARSSDPFA